MSFCDPPRAKSWRRHWFDWWQVCKAGRMQFLEQLIYYGADVNCRNYSGNTPLHICAIYNQVWLIFARTCSCSLTVWFLFADLQNALLQFTVTGSIAILSKYLFVLIIESEYESEGPVWLQSPISYPIDALLYFGIWLSLTTTSRQTWLFSSTSTVNVSLNRPPNRTWRRPPGRPRYKWLGQLRNDSTRPIGDLWRRAVDRGHGGSTTRRPSPATRRRWWW